MSNIDELFKNGLNGKGMEYSDASWAGMEQMLHGKKLGFFARHKLLLGIVGILLFSSATLFYYANNSTRKTANTPAVVSDHTLNEKGISVYDNPTKVTDYETSKDQNYLKSWTSSIEQENSSTTRADAVSTPWVRSEAIKQENNVLYSPKSSRAGAGAKDDVSKTELPREISRVQDVVSEGVNTSDVIQNEVEPKQSVGIKDVLAKTNGGNLIKASRIDFAGFSTNTSPLDRSVLDFLPPAKRRKYGLYLSPFAGLVNYSKSVNTPKFVTDDNDNFSKSSPQQSVNYGINVGVKKGKWMLSTGIGILELSERTFYTTQMDEYEYTTAPRITNAQYTTTPRGTRVALITETRIDSTLISTTVNECAGCEVQFNYVSVPLQVQYTAGRSRVRGFLEVGVVASFLQNANGVYATLKDANSDLAVVPSTQLVDLSTTDEVSKILMQASAAVGAKLWLAPRWNVWSSYGYGFGLNSMLRSYEQNANLQNVRVGLEFKLK